jgi:hypothetical protein
LARPVLANRLLAQLDHLAEHARTPGAGVYVLQIERLTAEALERFFDDGFLDLLMAVRNALVINNQWMRYTEEGIRAMQAVIRKYADFPPDNGLAFRRAALELNQRGIDTMPLELPTDLLLDEGE